jgi:hypothetical protein
MVVSQKKIQDSTLSYSKNAAEKLCTALYSIHIQGVKKKKK